MKVCKILLFLIVSSVISLLYAQQAEICGVGSLSESERQILWEIQNNWLSKYNKGLTESITIPIAFHIVHHNGIGNVSDQVIQNQLTVLNTTYSNTLFNFSIHSINRVNNFDWSTHSSSMSTVAIQMRQNLAINPIEILNFYICDLDPNGDTGVYGYATYPWMYQNDPWQNCVVVKYTTLPGGNHANWNEGKAGTHEVGHFFGLIHPFEGACDPASQDDLVSDTPKQSFTNENKCNSNEDSCPLEPGLDNIHNYMVYSPDNCRYEFTSGQIDRMYQQMLMYRPQMIGEENVVYVTQLRESDNLIMGSKIYLYNTSSSVFEEYQIPAPYFNLEPYANETFKGSQALIYNPVEKFHIWKVNNNNYNIINHTSFDIIPQYVFTSQFKKSYAGITIKNNIDGFNVGTIGFKDPWLIDYPDPEYPMPQGDYYKRNRGMVNSGNDSLIFKDRPSPFSPGYTTSYNGDVHQGVFLNQPYTGNNPVYYSVKAPNTFINPQTGQTHQLYFYGWDYNANKIGLRYPQATETAIVFKDDNAELTAKQKGTQLANTSTAYNNTSQNKFLKTYEGGTEYLHNVYESLGDIYYEISMDGGTNWTIMNDGKPINPYPDYGEAKSPSITCPNDGHNLIYITYQSSRDEGIAGPVVMLTQFKNGQLNWHRTVYDLSGFSFSEDYQPVVAAMNGVVLVVFNPPSPSTLGLISREYIISYADNITAEYSRTLPNVDASSCYPSITAAAGLYHLAYQQAAFSIKYLRWTVNTNPLTSSYSSTPSTGSGYSLNTEPSISLAYFNPVISWKGAQYSGSPQAVLRRGTLSGTNIIWSDFLKVGSNANYVHNNSTYFTSPSTAEKTVMCWGENNSIIKWVKRTFDSSHTTYSTPANLSHTGIRSQITSGSDYNNMKANIFRSSTPLYYFTQSTTDFSVLQEQGGELNKITVDDTIVTFGRSGVAEINGVEFIFEIGDVLVGDSIIQFIDKPDTIVYASSNELNEFTRTNNFTLNPATNFFFSNIYYVVTKSNPDTALTHTDAVNFKAELVNALTNQVIGTFDNITYNKTNLEKYASIDYQVDCSGITSGDYYLRLVTNVNRNANYALANIITVNTTLAKKNFNKVNFLGSEIPITYELSYNFPNPFNPSTTIRYQIPQDGIVTLKIYDILGSEVATLVNEEKVAGKYEVNFNASALASGVYIYKIQANSFISSKKMILIK